MYTNGNCVEVAHSKFRQTRLHVNQPEQDAYKVDEIYLLPTSQQTRSVLQSSVIPNNPY